MGAADISVLDFWWRLLWFSEPEWVAWFSVGEGVNVNCFVRFASGATPANLLAACMATEHFSST